MHQVMKNYYKNSFNINLENFKHCYYYKTKILVASIRKLDHVIESAIIGADVVTIPPNILEMLYDHPLTKKGLDAFLNVFKSCAAL